MTATESRLYDNATVNAPRPFEGKPLEFFVGATPAQWAVTALCVLTFVFGVLFAVLMPTTTLSIVALVAVVIVMLLIYSLNFRPWAGGTSPGPHTRRADSLVRDLAHRLRTRKATAYASPLHTHGYDSITGAAVAATPPPEQAGMVFYRRNALAVETGFVENTVLRRTIAFLEVTPPPHANIGPKELDALIKAEHNMRHTLAASTFASMLIDLTDITTEGAHGLPTEDLTITGDLSQPGKKSAHAERLAAAEKAPAFRSWRGLSIDAGTTWAAAVEARMKRDRSTRAAAVGELVADELARFTTLLVAAGFTVHGPVNLAGVISLTRSAYDPTVRVTRPGQRGLTNRVSAYPIRRQKPCDDHVEADGFKTATLRVERPRNAEPALFDRTLNTGEPQLTRRLITLTRLTRPSEARATFARNARRGAQTERVLHDENVGDNYAAEKHADKAQQRRNAADETNDHGATTVTYIQLHVPVTQDFQTAVNKLKDMAALTGQPLDEMWKAQDQAHAYGMPFGEGLK